MFLSLSRRSIWLGIGLGLAFFVFLTLTAGAKTSDDDQGLTAIGGGGEQAGQQIQAKKPARKTGKAPEEIKRERRKKKNEPSGDERQGQQQRGSRGQIKGKAGGESRSSSDGRQGEEERDAGKLRGKSKKKGARGSEFESLDQGTQGQGPSSRGKDKSFLGQLFGGQQGGDSSSGSRGFKEKSTRSFDDRSADREGSTGFQPFSGKSDNRGSGEGSPGRDVGPPEQFPRLTGDDWLPGRRFGPPTDDEDFGFKKGLKKNKSDVRSKSKRESKSAEAAESGGEQFTPPGNGESGFHRENNGRSQFQSRREKSRTSGSSGEGMQTGMPREDGFIESGDRQIMGPQDGSGFTPSGEDGRNTSGFQDGGSTPHSRSGDGGGGGSGTPPPHGNFGASVWYLLRGLFAG